MIGGAVSAGQRVREPRLQHAPLRVQPARGPVPDVVVWSRTLIWLAALLAFLTLDPHRNPLARLSLCTRAAWAGLEQLASGSHVHRYWPAVHDMDPLRVAVINLQDFGFLVLFLALTIAAWRRFGAPYGLFAALSLALPLSVPSSQWPLQSLPRFGLGIFPLFLALASFGGRPRVHTAIVAVSSVLLGLAVTEWVLWQWVA
jgi:hypothetical protein